MSSMNRAAVFLALSALCGASPRDACSPWIEERGNEPVALFRPHRNAFLDCPVSEEAYRRVIAEWLRKREAAAPPVRSVSLGRAAGYPWISTYLAQAALKHPRWDPSRGRSHGGNANAAVAAILMEPAFLERLEAPFKGSGYSIASISAEKVLVGKAGKASPSATRRLLVPYDAQVWLVLR